MVEHYQIKGWSLLAAAVLASGSKEHDTEFLGSNWADVLRELCALKDQMDNKRHAPLVRASRGYMSVIDESESR